MKLSQEQKLEIYQNGLDDPVYFFRVVLPGWFPKAMPWFHRGLLALMTRQTDFLLHFGKERWRDEESEWTPAGLKKILKHFTWSQNPDDPKAETFPIFVPDVVDGKVVGISMQVSQIQQEIIPRGFSKTTLCNGVILRNVVYKMRKFMVFVAETGPHAASQLGNVKEQLAENQLLIEVYGKLAPDRNDSHIWRETEAHTMNDVWLVARGRGGQVRGLNRGGARPSLIIVDDCEDEESVLTEEQRKKSLKWIVSAVRPALPRNDPDAYIQVLGTLLHPDSMLAQLSRDPSVITTKFGAIDPDGDMLWDAHMNKRQYDALRASYKAVGELASFAREFDSAISTDEEKVFHVDRILYIPKTIEMFLSRALALDPAISEDLHADYCAFAVVGMEHSGILHVLDFYMKRGMSPREQIDKFFELKILWDCTRCGVEAVAYQKALVHLIKEEMFRKSRIYGDKAYFEVEPITYNNDKDKLTRVQGVLAPRYSAGYVTHQRRFPDLEGQMEDWPVGKLDGPDAVSMAVTLLDPAAGAALPAGLSGRDASQLDQWEALERQIGGDWHVRGI